MTQCNQTNKADKDALSLCHSLVADEAKQHRHQLTQRVRFRPKGVAAGCRGGEGQRACVFEGVHGLCVFGVIHSPLCLLVQQDE